MGFFGGLNAEKYDRQYSDRQLVGRIAEYFKPQVKRLSFVSALVVAIAGVGAMLPVVVSRIVDLLKEQPTVQAISLAGLALLFVGVGIWGGLELGAARAGGALGRRRGVGIAHEGFPRRCRA